MSAANTPSEAYHAGKCPCCLGHGTTYKFVPVPGEGPCLGCGGEGTLYGFEQHQEWLWAMDEVMAMDEGLPND